MDFSTRADDGDDRHTARIAPELNLTFTAITSIPQTVGDFVRGRSA